MDRVVPDRDPRQQPGGPTSWFRSVRRLPERHPGRTITAVGVLFVLAYASSLVLLPKPDGRIVLGDAVHYYVYLRSAVYDRDLQFRNDYVRLYGLKGGEKGTEWVYEPTDTGHTRNMMAVGTAIAWSPLFVLATGLLHVGRWFGSVYPVDGFGRSFQATAGFSGILAATWGAWLAYRLCRSRFGPRVAIWSTLAVWLASSAVYYSVVSPTYSHAVSMLGSGAFFWYWATTFDQQTPGRYARLGALAGLVTLVRWQDAVFLIAPTVEALWHLQPSPIAHARRLRTAAVNLSSCILAATLVFSPQLMVWMTLYGDPLVVPQGSGFMRWTEPALIRVLVSDAHGLFSWTPVVVIGVCGLVPLARRERVLGLGLAAAFVASWYVNAAVADWWAGEAFGARRFVSCTPIFVMGTAAILSRLRSRSRIVSVVSVFVVANFLLLLQYQVFMHGLREVAPYPSGVYGLGLARFVVPIDLLRWLGEG